MIARRVAVAAVVATAVILSAPYVQQAFTAVADSWPRQLRPLAVAASAVPVGVAFLVALIRIRSRRGLRYGALAASGAIGAAYALGTGVSFGEAFHFVEYGFITLLLYRAWRPLDDARLIVLPVLATLMAGVADEWFQWFIPIRVGEARDVALNGVAAACGLLYAVALDPPGRVALSAPRESGARLAPWIVATLVVFGLFVQTVHVGHDVADEELGSFRSRYTAAELLAAADARAARWREQPPLTLRRLSREDQYLTEGLWRVQRRNQAWDAGDIAAAWRENRILEKFYAPVLDTPSYVSAAGHRWPPEQRADAESAGASLGAPYASADYAYPMYAWPGGGVSTLFLLKLLLVPGLVAAVTLAVRRWGPALGGWLAGLPVVAGPVLVFYAIEQGNAFAARAAEATLAGLVATVAFCVAYGRTSARLPWYGCVALGWSVFAAVVGVLHVLRPGLVAGLVSLVVAAALARRVLPGEAPVTAPAAVPAGDLAIRLVATATLVVVLTGIADELGSGLSGLLNAFPVLTTIVAAFTHAQRGAGATIAFLKGYLQAVVGFASFCVAMALALGPLGLPLALAAALLVQSVVHGLLLWRAAQP